MYVSYLVYTRQTYFCRVECMNWLTDMVMYRDVKICLLVCISIDRWEKGAFPVGNVDYIPDDLIHLTK